MAGKRNTFHPDFLSLLLQRKQLPVMVVLRENQGTEGSVAIQGGPALFSSLKSMKKLRKCEKKNLASPLLYFFLET